MTLLNGNTPCPGCGYNLRGLAQQHRCPECGHRYDFRARAASATADAPQFGRMNGFDKGCAILGVVLGVLLLFAGVPGLLLGLKISVDLPPLLGALPALASWGIYRTFRIVWRADQAAREVRLPPKPIPNIYRDPIPTARVEALDRELAGQIPEPPDAPSADAYPR